MIDWDNINPGKKPVCIVGAGFQMAVLCKALPSTKEIIKETVENQREQFPILSQLFDKKISPRYDLYYIWKNIEFLSLSLVDYYSEIESSYSKQSNKKIINVIEKYKEYNQPPCTIIWVILGLELKKMLAYQYNSNKNKINGDSFKKSAIDNLKKIGNYSA